MRSLASTAPLPTGGSGSIADTDWTERAGGDLLVGRRDDVGLLRLNRPRAINALTYEMVRELSDVLHAWADDDAVARVRLEGAGERGLCSGADVRALRDLVLAGGDPMPFFRDEYVLNALIADYPKPYRAAMTGIVMGGGLGVSMHGSERRVDATTRAAMPETVIGFFPDVGALWYLSRAPGEIGTYLALTGLPMTGADAIAVGLADSGAEGEPPLLAQRSWIDPCFAGEDADAILDRLRAHPAPDARAAGDVIASRSPTACRATIGAIRRAALAPSLQAVLEADLTLAAELATGPDFVEGVRATLVDRDGSPRWSHSW